jgi:hypothetical protein
VLSGAIDTYYIYKGVEPVLMRLPINGFNTQDMASMLEVNLWPLLLISSPTEVEPFTC